MIPPPTLAAAAAGSLVPLALAAWALSTPPHAGAGQRPGIDRGVLLVERDGVLIGREEFVVRQSRVSDGRQGFILRVDARYPAEGYGAILTPIVEFGPDSQPITVQFDADIPEQQRTYVKFGPRRVVIRTVTSTRESAREYPGAGRHLVVDDSVHGLFAMMPVISGGSVQLLAPRAGGRASARFLDRGTERTDLSGETRELRHVVLQAGERVRHLWYDEAGRLQKVTEPARNLVATRVRDVQD